MGSGFRGNYGKTNGASLAAMISKNYITVKGTSPNNNITDLLSTYKYNKITGKFGEKSKNCQIIISNNPIDDSNNFFKIISNGGDITNLPNGKGKKVTFTDGTVITHRIITSTPNSPAIDINVETHNSGEISSQKIHFVKKEEK